MQKYSTKNKNREFQSNQWSKKCWYAQFAIDTETCTSVAWIKLWEFSDKRYMIKDIWYAFAVKPHP